MPHENAGGSHPVPAVVARAAQHSHPGDLAPVLLLRQGVGQVLEPLLLPPGLLPVRAAHQDGDGPVGSANDSIVLVLPAHQTPDRAGHPQGGPLHQVQGRDAVFLNGLPVQLLHLGRRGNHHRSSAPFQSLGSSSDSGTSSTARAAASLEG